MAEVADRVSDEELVKADIRRHQELKSERAPLDNLYREVEQLCDPMAAGGFTPMAPGQQRNHNFDSTAIDGLDRFTAALGAVTTPKNQRWHGLTVLDRELVKVSSVQRWLEHAVDRLFACRYAPHAGISTAYAEDRRALGCYGTGALWIDEVRGRALFGRALHMSQIYVDVDFRGRVDTVHREWEQTARQAAQLFGVDNLPPKIREAYADPAKCDSTKFTFLHVIRPNHAREPDRFDHRAKPWSSRYIGVAEKWLIQRGGYWTLPIAVSRNVTSPGQKYGTSPMMKVLGTAKGLQEIAKTILRAGHKAVDPALAFYDDGDISKLVTKPGGMNPGLVDAEGRLLVQQVPGGGNHGLGREIQDGERAVVKTAFLEDFFRILTDPADRMTATQVLEMIAKQGVLIQEFADRYESEKLGVGVERELDILIRAGQIDPLPAEMEEAGAQPLVVMTNPLARMARAQEAAAFTRWVELGVQAASAGRPEALDRVDFDTGMVGVAEVLGVRPSWIKTDDDLAEERRQRAEKEEAAAIAQVVPDAAGAALALAKANQLAEGLGQGGGL